MPTGIYKRKPFTEEHKRKISENHSRYWLGKKMPLPSKETRQKISEAHRGNKNYNWKGDDVGYVSLHKWVVRHKGQPEKCEYCGTTNKERKLSWANVDHKYRRNLDDYISLCYKCHSKYDVEYNGKKFTLNNKLGSNQYVKKYK